MMPKFDDELLPGETLPTVEIETELTVAPVEGEQYSPSYKYSEDRILAEVKSYVDSTYGQHYSRNKFQATEFILDGGHGDGFCIGNIMKYAQRYGKKDGYNRKDLLKIIHYAIIALHNHDMNERK
jgi:hypothetical protein